MGDMNIDLHTLSFVNSDYMNKILSPGFCQVIDCPTRVTATLKTIVDQVLHNDLYPNIKSRILQFTKLDHGEFF